MYGGGILLRLRNRFGGDADARRTLSLFRLIMPTVIFLRLDAGHCSAASFDDQTHKVWFRFTCDDLDGFFRSQSQSVFFSAMTVCTENIAFSHFFKYRFPASTIT